MTVRDWREVRLTAGGRCADNGSDIRICVVAPSTDVEREVSRQVAARWNACADAFELLATAVEDDDWLTVRDAAVTLRRAIYGDESR